jgi:very-short-patch-repair endonuclease
VRPSGPHFWQEGSDSATLLARSCDAAVAEVAARQGGAVSLGQLRAAGLRSGAIKYRVASGRLHPWYRGVYAVGHRALTPRGYLWAAVLAFGGPDRAVLSHRSAAALWDLIPHPARPEVTTVANSRSTRAITVHRTQSLPVTDVVRDEGGLPRTSLARTLSDLARTTEGHRLERLAHEAEHRRVLEAAELAPHTPGARRLRHAMTTLEAGEPQVARSELEVRFLELVARAGLPRPEVNAALHGFVVDFLWRDRRLVVETDGAATHLTARAFEEDRRRDATLHAAGHTVLRFTWRQIAAHGDWVVRILRGS